MNFFPLYCNDELVLLIKIGKVERAKNEHFETAASESQTNYLSLFVI